MPSHYMYPVSDQWNSHKERGIDFELSEDFYGLMGGGITALFDEYPSIFEQVEQLSGVDFNPIMPIYYSVRMEPDRKSPEYKEYSIQAWQDIYVVQSKFLELCKILNNFPHLSEEITLKEDEYTPDKKYFSNFNKGKIILDFFKEGPSYELYHKYYPDIDESYWWMELADNETLEIPEGEWSFGHDVYTVICFIEMAISKGAMKFRLNGR